MINKDRLVKLTQKVLSYDSQNPPGTEYDCAKFIEKDMRSLGLEVKLYTYAKKRPNIVATLKGSLPRAQASKKAILLTPHFDTVPVGKGWKYNAFGKDIVAGKLYGRGATDDKGNLASCMEVMRSLVEDGVQLQKDVVMAATVDEETGSFAGIIPLLEKGVLKPAFAVVMDSTEYDAVVAQKGLIHGRIQIFGKKAHSAYNWRGVSAIENAAEVINRLKKMKYPFKKHKILRPPTMNIGVIHGGDKVNMVADLCEFTFDARFLPGTSHKALLQLIKKTISEVTNRYDIEIDDIQQPYEIKANHPWVKAYLDVCKKNKADAKPKGSEGATVITFFQNHNIPAFATGWGASGTAHTNDEFIRVNTLFKGTKILEEFIKKYDQL